MCTPARLRAGIARGSGHAAAAPITTRSGGDRGACRGGRPGSPCTRGARCARGPPPGSGTTTPPPPPATSDRPPAQSPSRPALCPGGLLRSMSRRRLALRVWRIVRQQRRSGWPHRRHLKACLTWRTRGMGFWARPGRRQAFLITSDSESMRARGIRDSCGPWVGGGGKLEAIAGCNLQAKPAHSSSRSCQ